MTRYVPMTPFIPLAKRSSPYAQGFRAGTKAAVMWLDRRADELADAGTKSSRAAALALRRATADMAREANDIAALDPPDPREGGEG